MLNNKDKTLFFYEFIYEEHITNYKRKNRKIKLLNELKKAIKNWDYFNHNKKLDCSICLSEITNKFNYVKTKCNHTFCKKCINNWTKKNNTCPNCRQPLFSSKNKYNELEINHMIQFIFNI
tara:strand:+ start:497 stop:859 length:363 start_codon:yes stop_codon:yes gene_type:complete